MQEDTSLDAVKKAILSGGIPKKEVLNQLTEKIFKASASSLYSSLSLEAKEGEKLC